jgi:hypothetical protein
MLAGLVKPVKILKNVLIYILNGDRALMLIMQLQIIDKEKNCTKPSSLKIPV